MKHNIYGIHSLWLIRNVYIENSGESMLTLMAVISGLVGGLQRAFIFTLQRSSNNVNGFITMLVRKT